MKVRTMDLSLSNSTTMALLNETANHEREGQAAQDGLVKSHTVVEFASGKGQANDTHKRQTFSS